MLNDAGAATHVILGHSERRHGPWERPTPRSTAKAPTPRLRLPALIPIVCIGELREDRREAGPDRGRGFRTAHRLARRALGGADGRGCPRVTSRCLGDRHRPDGLSAAGAGGFTPSFAAGWFRGSTKRPRRESSSSTGGSVQGRQCRRPACPAPNIDGAARGRARA